VIFQHLANGFGWAEIPLLPYNFPERTSTVWRPPQNELLRAFCILFLEDQRNASEALRLIEDEADCLSSRTSRTPAPGLP
jgi:hypothetical protein